jgi:hypothetical protein
VKKSGGVEIGGRYHVQGTAKISRPKEAQIPSLPAGYRTFATANGNHVVITWVTLNLPAFLRGTQVNPLDIRNVPPILAGKFLPPPGQQERLFASRFNFFTISLFQKGNFISSLWKREAGRDFRELFSNPS